MSGGVPPTPGRGTGVPSAVTVSVPVMFGERHVAPLIPRLLARHEDLRIELSLEDRYVNLVEELEVAEGDSGPELVLRASVTAIDGSDAVRGSISGPLPDAVALGRALATELLDRGAAELMAVSL